MIHTIFLQYIKILATNITTRFHMVGNTLSMEVFVSGSENPAFYCSTCKLKEWGAGRTNGSQSATSLFSFKAPNGLEISLQFNLFNSKVVMEASQPERVKLSQTVKIKRMRLDNLDGEALFVLEPEKDYPEITLKIFAT